MTSHEYLCRLLALLDPWGRGLVSDQRCVERAYARIPLRSGERTIADVDGVDAHQSSDTDGTDRLKTAGGWDRDHDR